MIDATILTSGRWHDSAQAVALLDEFTFANMLANCGSAGRSFLHRSDHSLLSPI